MIKNEENDLHLLTILLRMFLKAKALNYLCSRETERHNYLQKVLGMEGDLSCKAGSTDVQCCRVFSVREQV